MNTRVIYEERSSWPWWVHPLVWVTFLAAVFPLVELARGNVGSEPGPSAETGPSSCTCRMVHVSMWARPSRNEFSSGSQRR
jgi:hypothetical protein